ncbi:MAG: TetR family transcriptional regulator [Bacillota bacterium]
MKLINRVQIRYAAREGFKLAVDRKREIIDAAAELFREKGYERTRLQDIAEKVGLLKGLSEFLQ